MKVLIGKPPGPRSKKKQRVSVRIDPWDTWSMDHTLTPLVLPMLLQLKSTNQGAPLVDDADVPEALRSTNAGPKENDFDVDKFHFDRWAWVMDEMIFAFETKCTDDYLAPYFTPNPNYVPTGKNWMDKSITDIVGIGIMEKRMQNGFVLFGKYFQALWN